MQRAVIEPPNNFVAQPSPVNQVKPSTPKEITTTPHKKQKSKKNKKILFDAVRMFKERKHNKIRSSSNSSKHDKTSRSYS